MMKLDTYPKEEEEAEEKKNPFRKGLCQLVQVQCFFTSTETTRTISDGEPRTATSTFTQLLSSAIVPAGCTMAEEGRLTSAPHPFDQFLRESCRGQADSAWRQDCLCDWGTR